MTKIAVELQNISKQFSGPGGETVQAVDNVNLKIRDGEFFSLLGPSGCGKTTTLRMIGGFEIPTSGEIYIDSEPLGYTPPNQRPVNTVFQSYALFPHMTVFDNVSFGLQMKKVEKAELKRRTSEALELVQMLPMARRKPDQLSGGQRQRVALARALVNHPKVLLLDEPLGALDFKLRKQMQFELKALQERVGITFIYVTHDQEEALTMSDRIAVMNHGKMLQVGSAQEIYEAPNSRFVADFIGDTNYLRGVVTERRDDVVKVRISEEFEVLAIGEPELTEGLRVTLAFRPEKVMISDCGDVSLSNCSQGIVKDVVYMGLATNYHVELSDKQIVKVRQQNSQTLFDTVFHPGDPVNVTWPIVNCKAFLEDPEDGGVVTE